MTKLLVIDDEVPILKMLKLSLSIEGYDVLTAQSGEEGLKIFEEEAPKIILTDIRMPGMDGIQVLKRIKAADEEAEVIIITGHGDMDTAISALQYGASDFLTKPIRDEVLMLGIERAKKKININNQLKDYTNNLEQKVEQCKMELDQAQAELLKTERLFTIAEIVAGFTHCIKNILTGLSGGVYMVQTGVAKDKPHTLEEGWVMVQRNIDRVSDLVLDLLRYSGQKTPKRSVCIPNEIVSHVVKRLDPLAREHKIKLHKVLDSKLEKAYLEPEGIQRVLFNLVSNAIDACIYDKATTKKWAVTIETKLEIDADSGETILLEVTDTGCGMTDEVKSNLFTKFFSTKAGRGTGIGLLVTRKIVHEHGGEISLESKAGEGTTFSVRLKRQMPDNA